MRNAECGRRKPIDGELAIKVKNRGKHQTDNTTFISLHARNYENLKSETWHCPYFSITPDPITRRKIQSFPCRRDKTPVSSPPPWRGRVRISAETAKTAETAEDGPSATAKPAKTAKTAKPQQPSRIGVANCCRLLSRCAVDMPT